jgi:16S rRNA (cytosine967-C5)-methyltransferase
VIAGTGAAQAPMPAASRPAVRDMAYAVVRQLGLLRALAGQLNKRAPTPLLSALQLAALSQLRDGRRAAAIVIDQAVAAAGRLPEGEGSRFAGGFLNATLRRFTREGAAMVAAVQAADPVARHNHPAWWLERLKAVWPTRWQAIAEASLEQAPLTLRVNRRRLDVEAASARLTAAGLHHHRTGAESLTLAQAVPVADIPGFADGDFTVQDAGAQFAAQWLAPRSGERVLDACAAPGGKTTHLLQLADCAVLALELDSARAARIGENLAREQLPQHTDWPAPSWGATVRVGDATDPAGWWDGKPFDRIMVDAPCSASGIVRRHPDVLWHRARRDLATFAGQQQRLLEALWPLLKPGGTLLYVTCSLFPDEGESVISAFCAHRADCERLPLELPGSEGGRRLVQLLPTRSSDRDHDGFTYALLSKRP